MNLQTLPKFKLIVAGGRDFNDYETLHNALYDLANGIYANREVSIVSGMARGADTLAVRFAHAVEKAAYEAAIKACESLENRVISTHPARIEFDPNSLMARKCAGAIRSLMEQPK